MAFVFCVSYLDFVLVVCAVAPTVKPMENETAFKKLKDGLLSATSGSVKENKDSSGFSFKETESTKYYCGWRLGAFGDLVKKKIFSAFFVLYHDGCLPKVCKIVFSFSHLLLISRFGSIGLIMNV